MAKTIRYTVTAADEGLPLRRILRDRCYLSAGQIRHILNTKGALILHASKARENIEPLFTMKTSVADGDEIEVVLSGSILTKLPSARYLEAIREKVAQYSDRRFAFLKLDVPPVMGCINWILQDYMQD